MGSRPSCSRILPRWTRAGFTASALVRRCTRIASTSFGFPRTRRSAGHVPRARRGRFRCCSRCWRRGPFISPGCCLLAPYLTAENHAELLARARFRTKREIEHLVAEIAPRPDVPARIEPLGPRPAVAANLWQAYTASLRGPVRELVPGVGAGDGPPDVGANSGEGAGEVPAESGGLGARAMPSRLSHPRRRGWKISRRPVFEAARAAPLPGGVHGE